MGDGMDTGKAPEPGGEAIHARRAARVKLNAEVVLRRPGGHNFRVRVFDLSPHGCKLEFVERPNLDERIWVKIDGLDALEGLVCWSEGFVAGVDFLRPIHAAVFDHVLRRLR